ncbi:MAG: hypothetical protein ACKO1O_12170, partial [Erythrobacter sp.]
FRGGEHLDPVAPEQRAGQERGGRKRGGDLVVVAVGGSTGSRRSGWWVRGRVIIGSGIGPRGITVTLA